MELFHEGFLAAASGFSDSSFPLLYCNMDLIVVDMNSAAKTAFGDKFRLKSLEKYLSVDEYNSVMAMLIACRELKVFDGVYATVKTHGAREFTWALVAPRSYLGEVYAEFRLFRNKREMLYSYGGREIIFPIKPTLPVYSEKSGREGSELIGSEVEKAFAYNMLSNLYECALEDKAPDSIDLVKTVKRIIFEASNSFGFNHLKWSIGKKSDSVTTYPLVSRRSFINIIALIVSVYSDISATGTAKIDIEADSGSITLDFTTKMKPRRIKFMGAFNLSLVGKLFPAVECRTQTVAFLCSAFGVGCYAKVVDGDDLVITLAMSKDGVEPPFEVRHVDRFDMNSMREAAALVKYLGSFEK